MSFLNAPNPLKNILSVDWNDIKNRPDLSGLSHMKGTEVVLLANKWEDGEQALVFEGITSNPVDQFICITPDENSKIFFHNSKISVKEKDNELVFHADIVPDDDITIYIYVINSVEVGVEITGTFEWWSPHMTSDTTPEPYVVSYSEPYASSLKGWKAFDGDTTTRFESDGAGSETYIQFGFGEKTIVSGIRLMAASNPDEFPKTFTVYASNDDKEWIVVYEEDGSNYPEEPSNNTFREYIFAKPVNYKYYKLILKDNYAGNKYMDIREFEFYKWEEDKE